MNDFLKNCEAAARAGGQVLLDWIGHFDTREKARFDMVTDADLASQEVVRGMLLAAYPDHGFLGEEGLPSGNSDAEYRWVVDPLDGTTNYIHQIPHYCTSVGLERRGELVCGAVYDPIMNECFTAAAGQGAYLNGKRISVSKIADVAEAVTVVSFPSHLEPGARELVEFGRVVSSCQAVRRTGSAALNLSYVAAGRFDSYWGGAHKPWDIAAGALFVIEAGGIITGYGAEPFRLEEPWLVASSTLTLHKEMLRLIGRKA